MANGRISISVVPQVPVIAVTSSVWTTDTIKVRVLEKGLILSLTASLYTPDVNTPCA